MFHSLINKNFIAEKCKKVDFQVQNNETNHIIFFFVPIYTDNCNAKHFFNIDKFQALKDIIIKVNEQFYWNFLSFYL